jgi:hypothetical protein
MLLGAMGARFRSVLCLAWCSMVCACGDHDRVGHLPDARPAPPDRDGDGVPDDLDNCPDVANPDQLDTDHDGIGDACDPTDDSSPVDERGCRRDHQELCGNGIDDNCDGNVDEGCPCTPGAVQPCFAGLPVQRHVGACVDGQQVCAGNPGRWSACAGGIAPTAEVCDGLDNNCNGATDEQLTCTQMLACPAPGSLPDASAFQDYVIDGTKLFGGDVQSWSWTVTGGPCEQLFAATGKPPGFTLTGSDTSQPTFTPTQSGDYTVKVAIVTAAGDTLGCTFIVHAAGSGLRVELCWDTSGVDDVDLHIHRPATPPVPVSNWFTDDDCYYANCKGSSAPHIDWGYPMSPLIECAGTPDGMAWTALGGCINPRLDIDNIAIPGRPENVTVDQPQDSTTYRVLVNYYAGSGVPHPLANIYCQGRLVASYGQAPDLVPGFDTPGADGGGSMWRVVDVTTHVDAAGVTTCDLQALHPADQTTGYDVRVGDSTY